MKNPATVLVLFNRTQLWLLGIITGLIAIHLTLTSRAKDSSLLGTSALFWIAVCYIIWQKRDELNLESRIFSSISGMAIVAFILLKSTSISLPGDLGQGINKISMTYGTLLHSHRG